ncbi:unnamed protein product [Clonostachys byssicola]|uniref:Uncharacterized protein n=1 Tax=Clonostachys byssicola TaxID=160290 RepID=A0A9N9UI73_9HYPO|nr:unnamed protein product [Clonostachys byssicola]
MCFRLATHITNCETRLISTLEVRHPELTYDIYNPFEDPRTCEHYVDQDDDNVTLCAVHGTCCQVSFEDVCVSWVNFGGPGGIIKCRGFKEFFHVIIPINGYNVEINRQFIGPDRNAVRLTDEEAQSLYDAQVAYFNEGGRVRVVLEDDNSQWITQANPPYDWRPTIDTTVPQNVDMLARFDTALERWKSTCVLLKIVHDPQQHENMKATQSEAPYWYQILRVPRPGHEGTPLPGPEGFVDDQVLEAGEGPAGPAGMDGGLVDSPGGNQNHLLAEQESSDESIPFLSEASSDGPNQIFSATPEEENEAVLEGNDEVVLEGDGEQEPPLAPAASGGLAPVAVLGDEPAGRQPQVPFGQVSGHGQLYGAAQAAVQALANPGGSAEQLSAMRDEIVQQPPGTAPGVRVEDGWVGIPVTGMVWLPAEGLLNPSPGGQYPARFYLDNVDDRGHHREPDALLRLPAGILWRLLNNVPRDVPQANLAQANLPQVQPPQGQPSQGQPPQGQPPQVPPPQVPPPQVHIPQANLSQANIRPEDIPVQSIEDENGDGPPWSPLADPGVPGGSGEGDSSTNTNTTRGSGGNQGNNEPLPPTQSPSGGVGDSSTNTNTTRGSGGNKENEEPLPPTQSPSNRQTQSAVRQPTPILVQSLPLQELGNGADGSQQSGPLLLANPLGLQEGGNSQEGRLLSDMSNSALQEQEIAPGAAGSSVSRKTRKRAAANEDDDEVEEEPAPPQPTRRQPTRRQPARRQPAKRRRVETPVNEPVDKSMEESVEGPVEGPVEEPVVEFRYKFRQRGKVNYKY